MANALETEVTTEAQTASKTSSLQLAIDQVANAVNLYHEIDTAGDNYVLTADDIYRHGIINITGVTVVSKEVTWPTGESRQILIFSDEANTQNVDIAHGTTSVSLEPGLAYWVISDGTANNLRVFSISAGGGGGVGSYVDEAGDTMSGPLIIALSAAGIPALTLQTTNDSATSGPQFVINRISASPAASDFISHFIFQGRDSANNVANYAQMLVTILDPTDGSEDGRILFQTIQGGASITSFDIRAGVLVGAPSGGDKGAGTLNAATALYEAGVALSAKYAALAGATFSGDIVFSNAIGSIRSDTADAADTKGVAISGGGTYSGTRGAYLQLWGNEHATLAGQASLSSGSTGHIILGNSGNGVVVGAPTGGAKGNGTLNAVSLYEAGIAISAKFLGIAGGTLTGALGIGSGITDYLDGSASATLLKLRGTGADLVTATTQGESTSGWQAERYSNNTGPPTNVFRKARGTIAAPADVIQNDIIMRLNGFARLSGSFVNIGLLDFLSVAATPSTTDRQSRAVMSLQPPAGAGAAVEVARWDGNGDYKITGKMGVGIQATEALQVYGNAAAVFADVIADGQLARLQATSYQGNSAAVVYYGRKARGSLAVPAVIQNGDDIFSFRAAAFDGATFPDIGRMDVTINQSSPGVGAMGSMWRFYLNQAGTTDANSEILRLDGSLITAGAPVLIPAGSVAAPGLKIGDADTGFFNDGSRISFGNDGVKTGHISAGGLTFETSIDLFFTFREYSATSHPLFNIARGRGSVAVPANVLQNDALGEIRWYGYGTGSRHAAGLRTVAIAATPSSTNMESRFEIQVAPPSSIVPSEVVRVEYATGLSMYGANPVINQDRGIVLRSTTIAGVASLAKTTGTRYWISDYRGGIEAVYDGANMVGAAIQYLQVAASDETTALTTGASKVKFRAPCAMKLSASALPRASLSTAQTSGSIFTVDINEGATTVLSTKLTIDNTERTSTTAAAACVISDTTIADDAEMHIDIDQVGDGTAKGLKVTIPYREVIA